MEALLQAYGEDEGADAEEGGVENGEKPTSNFAKDEEPEKKPRPGIATLPVPKATMGNDGSKALKAKASLLSGCVRDAEAQSPNDEEVPSPPRKRAKPDALTDALPKPKNDSVKPSYNPSRGVAPQSLLDRGTEEEGPTHQPEAKELYEEPAGPTAPHPSSAFMVGEGGEWLAPPPEVEQGEGGDGMKEVTGEQVREGQERAMAAHAPKSNALGQEYLAKLKRQAQSAPGGRPKHKHQINWVYAQAKQRELDIIEGKAQEMRPRREHAFRYGFK